MQAQEILAQLVAFPVLGGESNLSILHWIKDFIESHGIKTVLVPNKEGNKASLHCRIGPAVDGGLILSGHTDVVPVEGQQWDSDPFVLTEKGDGKLYGRGTCDMKGFLACCLEVFPEMVKASLKRPIYLAFSYDEEIGCRAGAELAAHLKMTYSEKPQYAIIGEPTLLQPVIGQKGYCVLETQVNGSAGHSSRIRQEVSAVHEAARLILWLENKMNVLVEAGQIDERFDPPHSSLHVGIIKGGVAPNIIADQVSFIWDMRIIPQDSMSDILAEFEKYCRQREAELATIFPAFKIKTSIHSPLVPPLNTAADTSILSLVQKISGQADWETVAYATEAGQFSEVGFESIICGPGSMLQGHRANEFISKEQLDSGVAMIRALVQEFS